MENGTQTNNVSIIEMKDSIKIAKNSKGYTYEIRLVGKENVYTLDQLDYVRTELVNRIKKWEAEDLKK
ncbi:hypothetical protein KAI04_04345 [Candidatus Pacearchaeota archaeon]|nr:hypothetical protein [Candidatus Pacearchaeota archaeon]